MLTTSLIDLSKTPFIFKCTWHD